MKSDAIGPENGYHPRHGQRISHQFTNYVPYCSLESLIEQSKEAYYLALRRTQSTLRQEAPDWESWLHSFLRCLHRQTRVLQERLAGRCFRLWLPDWPRLFRRMKRSRLLKPLPN